MPAFELSGARLAVLVVDAPPPPETPAPSLTAHADRTITLKLDPAGQNAAAVRLILRGEPTFTWWLDNHRAVAFDVLSGTLSDDDVTLTLTCKPYWRGVR